MVKCTLFDYNNKDSVKKFYSFYQNFLLNSFMFEELGSYQSFIQKLRENDFYEALILSSEKELGGVIFEYEKSSNKGIIHYLEVQNNDGYLTQMLYDFALYRLNEISNSFSLENPEIVQNIPKRKEEYSSLDSASSNEYFLKKLVIPSIDRKFKNE